MQDAENKVNNDSLVETSDAVSKIYEFGYLLVPTIKEEDLSVNYGNIKELVSSFGGEIIADDMPKAINLALDPNFIRFLILKTVKENTIATKRFVRGETYKRPKAKSKENEVAVPINEKEIDKEIGAMVAM